MSSNDQHLSSKNCLFKRLKKLDNILIFPEPSVDIIQFFIREFKFLDIFLSLQSYTDEQYSDMIDVTRKVQALFEDALVDFSERDLAKYFEFYASKVQNNIWLAKMEIRARYSFPKIASLPVSANKEGTIAIPKFVTEFISYMVENLRDLVTIHGACSFLNVPPETLEHIEDVFKELILLENFVSFVSERIIEPIQNQHYANFFTHVLAVAGHTSMLAWLYFSGRGYENQDVAALGEINVFLLVQMKFKPIQPRIRKIYVAVLQALETTIRSGGWCPNIQSKHIAAVIEANFLETIQHHLVELPTNSNSNQRVALKDHLEILQEMLNFLRATIIHVSVQDLEFLQDINTLVIDVGLLVYSLYEEEEKEDMALGEVNSTLVLDLSGKIQHLNTVIYLTIRKAFQCNLPRIQGLGYVDFLLNNLKEFQSRHSDSLASFMNQLENIQKELESLQPFLEAVAEERHNYLDKLQLCATKLIGKAYEVEFVVDACISKKAPVFCLERFLLDIMEEITLVRDEIVEMHETKMDWDTMNTVTYHTSSKLARIPRMNEEIVGFGDAIEKLRDQLIRGTKGRDTISIVGMPGLGKTTLAYRLYSDRLVVSHFDIRAQCCVSQVYSHKDLLLAILRDVSGENPECRDKQADELADQLRKSLFSKRYLILVDDVWEASVWDDLKGCFHDANNGSRIILTTRSHEVANYARFQSDPLPLRMFSDDESWELLRKKIFGEESCSPSLTNIGLQIAKKCGQLPLSVTLVAGILAEMEKKEECWEQVANNLGSHIHSDSRAIIEHSYQRLPYHLRSCFLYFGAFLEDSVINVSKLIRLWISEGFIKSRKGKGLEDIAEGYLENLIGRNLVIGTKWCSRGKIKACRIHDLLHDFCKVRAKEENLLLCIRRDQNADPSSRAYCHKLVHRISFDGKGNHIGEWSSCWSHVSSILHNGCISFDTVSNIFQTFKFLKVLDLESTDIKAFPTDLVYLRYFAAHTRVRSMSSYIANCRNLETLILTVSRAKMSIPITLWEMVKLRHLHISSCRLTIENAKVLLENSKKLYDLKTLSCPIFSCARDAELILGRTPNLQELICIVEGVDKVQQYYVLNFPTQTETLKIRCEEMGDETIPFCISAPNLKKLTLDGFLLHPQHLSEIASLPKLQVLKLDCVQFDNEEWKVSNDEFPQLKVLKLRKIVRLREWIVADDAFPHLERLVLSYCRNLKEIPSCFGDLCCLKSIKVHNCSNSVKKSARVIRETQVEDYQNTGFELFIQQRRKYYFAPYIVKFDED